MSAIVPCPGCQAPLAVGPELVGHTIACPACGKLIQLAGNAPTNPSPSFGPGSARSTALAGAGGQIVPNPALSERPQAGKPSPKRSRISPAILVGWGVIACFLLGSVVLLFALRARTLAERAQNQEAPVVAPSAEQPDGPANSAATHSGSAAPAAIQTGVPETSSQLSSAGQLPDAGPSAASNPSNTSGLSPRFPPPGPQANVPPGVVPLGSPPPGPASNSNSSPTSAAANPPAGNSSSSNGEGSERVPPVAAGGNALSGLADTWKLPPLISSQAEKLAKLSSTPAEPLRLVVRSLPADLPDKAAVFAEEVAEGSQWKLTFVNNLETGEGQAPLAEVRLDGRDLVFQWTDPPADAALRRQLANCLLEVREGNEVHVAQLRAAGLPGPCTVDLADDVQTIEFPISDMPKADLLQLEVRDLVGFPAKAALRDDKRVVAPGGRTVIEFGDMPGAEIGLEFVKLPTGVLVVRLESEFRENSARKYDMTIARLDALEKGMQKSLASAQKELPEAQANLRTLQNNLQSVASRGASTLQQQTVRDQLLSSLSNKVKAAGKKVTLLQKQIAESEARLSAVPKIRDFLDSIHQKAQIKFVLSAECGERDLVLVDATQAGPATQGAE